MVKRFFPHITIAGWGGPGETDDTFYDGQSLVIEWFGFIIEICLGRAK
ncbi:MAG: hypothetical protein AB7E55_29975 [Pigmentiphaga sp.]